jgi:hypothetical protein
MARIALGITLLLLVVTCGLEFKTWNKVQGLNQQVATETTDANNAKQAAARAQASLKIAQDDLTKEKATEADTESKLAAAQSSLDAANAQIATDKSSIDDLNKKIATLVGSPTAQPTDLKYTEDQMKAVQDQLKDATAQVAELKEVKDTLTQKVTDAESRADDLEKVVAQYKGHILKNGLEGEVLAVNPGWNFVVLSIGDRQGAIANAEMILVRNGSEIGKVKITSVEPSTSVADIVPGSLGRGVRVQAGDRVIFHGS